MLGRILSKISRNAADKVYKILEEIRKSKRLIALVKKTVPIIV